MKRGGGGLRANRERQTHLYKYKEVFEDSLLVSDGLDGLRSTLIVMFLHVPVHGAQLHLPSEVDIHRTLLHCGVDELIGWVTQLEARQSRETLFLRGQSYWWGISGASGNS